MTENWKIETYLRHLHTHDAWVGSISYLEAQCQIIIDLELPDDSPEQFGRVGEMVFCEVDNLRVSIPLDHIDWAKTAVQILDLSHTPEKDSDGLKAVFCELHVEYENGTKEPLHITFLAKYFQWVVRQPADD